MQGGVVAWVVGEYGNGVYAVGAGGQGDAVARFDRAGAGQVLDLLQADLRGRRCTGPHAVPGMFGMRAGLRHGGVFHGPGYGLARCAVELASLLIGLGHIVPHRCREGVPDIGVVLAPETGPGHATEQHQ
ncbi:hypothetical protein D3C77_456370 [compost metagenome]